MRLRINITATLNTNLDELTTLHDLMRAREKVELEMSDLELHQAQTNRLNSFDYHSLTVAYRELFERIDAKITKVAKGK